MNRSQTITTYTPDELAEFLEQIYSLHFDDGRPNLASTRMFLACIRVLRFIPELQSAAHNWEQAAVAWNARADRLEHSNALARRALQRVAALNEHAGEIGPGMLATIVQEAREALATMDKEVTRE